MLVGGDEQLRQRHRHVTRKITLRKVWASTCGSPPRLARVNELHLEFHRADVAARRVPPVADVENLDEVEVCFPRLRLASSTCCRWDELPGSLHRRRCLPIPPTRKKQLPRASSTRLSPVTPACSPRAPSRRRVPSSWTSSSARR